MLREWSRHFPKLYVICECCDSTNSTDEYKYIEEATMDGNSFEPDSRTFI